MVHIYARSYYDAPTEVNHALETAGVFKFFVPGPPPMYIRTIKADREYYNKRIRKRSNQSMQKTDTSSRRMVPLAHSHKPYTWDQPQSHASNAPKPQKAQSVVPQAKPGWFAEHQAKLHAQTLTTRELQRQSSEQLAQIAS